MPRSSLIPPPLLPPDELLYRINKDRKSNKTSIELETNRDVAEHEQLRRLRRRQNDYSKALRSHSVFNHNRTISTQIEPVREGEYHEFSDHLRRKDLSAEQRRELLIQEKIYQRILGSDLEERDNEKITAAFKAQDRSGSGLINESQFLVALRNSGVVLGSADSTRLFRQLAAKQGGEALDYDLFMKQLHEKALETYDAKMLESEHVLPTRAE